MLLISLIIVFLGAIALIFNVQYQDEIHKLVAILSGLTALFILFILTPMIMKCVLGVLILFIFNKMTIIAKN